VIAKYYANYILNKVNSSSRKVKYSYSLKISYSIAVLFDTTDVNNIKIVNDFVYIFSSGKQKVSAMGYVNKSNTSFDHFSSLYFDYYSNKNLNWFGKPYGHLITNFLDYEYDILIYLSLKNHYALNYLLKASTAKFKIGASKKDITIFDQEINSENF
tara:strand:- start:3144 stop:3614 length:471 start_codon:yes stop_codon:yes gene_type:complete